LAEIVREPTFPEDEFETLREQQLAGLEQQRSDPGALAQTALARHMNPAPPGHPMYTPTVDESLAAWGAVTLDEARAFHRDFYGPQLGTLAVVGDFDPQEIRGVIEEAFGDWESPYAATRISTDFFEAPADVLRIETPDKANAFLFVQQNLALRDDHEDYPALTLAGYMMGGGFLNSRLSARIREQDGLSYSVQAQISGHPIDENGSFFAVAIQAPENAEKVEAALREEVQRVLDDGFTSDELEIAKQGYLQARELGRAQDASLVGMLTQGLYFDRTLFWDAEFEGDVRNLTAAEINAAVRRHLDLNKMTFVKAGDFANAGNPG
jgi:zinc protease